MTTKRLRRHRESDDDARLTELNLVTCKDGERVRWPLLASSKRSGDPFAYLLRPLVKYTKIPVMRFTNPKNGWDVAIEPFTTQTFGDD